MKVLPSPHLKLTASSMSLKVLVLMQFKLREVHNVCVREREKACVCEREIEKASVCVRQCVYLREGVFVSE